MYMDSSSGMLGNDLAYLMNVYARACRAVPPLPAGLAAWLVKLVCDGPGWPDVVLREWSPALGTKDLAEHARLVDERAAASESDDWHRQWAVGYLREQIAEVSGDVDSQVRVRGRRPARRAHSPAVRPLVGFPLVRGPASSRGARRAVVGCRQAHDPRRPIRSAGVSPFGVGSRTRR